MARKKTFGELIRTAREEQGLSLRDLECVTGVNYTTISKIENGDHENPKIQTLSAILKGLFMDSIEVDDCVVTLK